MPDLGKYGDTVMLAYGASLVLLLGLVALSIWRGRNIRAEMNRVEARVKRNG